jgi:ferredoxin
MALPGRVALTVVVDRVKCCGYSICAEICPQVYKLDDNGFAYVDDENVPPELAESAREGADACPELAITVTEVVPDQAS